MDWQAKIFDLTVGGIPSAALQAAAAVCPDHIKRQSLERLNDLNPFRTISANHDLVRATRLAWIEAAQVISKSAAQGQHDISTAEIREVDRFNELLKEILLQARDVALDRRRNPGTSPIDTNVQIIIHGVPEMVSPRVHPASQIGVAVTQSFQNTLAAMTGWPVAEIPHVYSSIAFAGVSQHSGEPPRSFGELVFAAFAEIIKDPRKYPQAREAFHIAMDKLARDIGTSTLEAVRSLQVEVEAAVAGLDALDVLRNGATKYLGLLPEIDKKLDRVNERLDALARDISKQDSVPLPMLRAILSEMGEEARVESVEDVTKLLSAKATEFKVLNERMRRITDGDPDIPRIKLNASVQMRDGRFRDADHTLSIAESLDCSEISSLEEAVRRRKLSAAETRGLRAGIAKLRATLEGYQEAILHYGEAARLSMSADATVGRSFAREVGLTLVQLGDRFGRNTCLQEAIDHFASIIAQLDRSVDKVDWAASQHGLGLALAALGRRQSDKSHLEGAVVAFRKALTGRSREADPAGWAANQDNLGNALSWLGEREKGIEPLQEAIASYRAALEVRTREISPLDWATTQNNLGNALLRVGERSSGTTFLELSAAAYRCALTERTRDKVPLEWAISNNNLGTVLRTIAEREPGTQHLMNAISAYRSALEECTRSRAPIYWAMILDNLGAALLMLSERTGKREDLQEAVKVFQFALEERTRTRAPLEWASTLNNLGTAYEKFGILEGDQTRLRDAILAYRSALEERTQQRVPLDWAATQHNLGNALLASAKFGEEANILKASIEAYENALLERRADRVPFDWAITLGNQAVALLRLGQRPSDLDLIERAHTQLRRAIEQMQSNGHTEYADYYSEQLCASK